jgi:hypothetical protein
LSAKLQCSCRPAAKCRAQRAYGKREGGQRVFVPPHLFGMLRAVLLSVGDVLFLASQPAHATNRDGETARCYDTASHMSRHRYRPRAAPFSDTHTAAARTLVWCWPASGEGATPVRDGHPRLPPHPHHYARHHHHHAARATSSLVESIPQTNFDIHQRPLQVTICAA